MARRIRRCLWGAFGVALSLVAMAGGGLFTGNNLVMAAGGLSGTVRWSGVAKLWIICWLGNLTGAVLLALLFWGTGLTDGAVGTSRCSGAIFGRLVGPLFSQKHLQFLKDMV